MFARRIVPVILALTVAFAPATLEACQAECAMHSATTAAAQPAQHSCHPSVPDSSGHRFLTSGTHSCGHSDELPVTAAAIVKLILPAPAILPAVFDALHLSIVALASTGAAFARDPVPLALTVPLRV